MTIPACNVVARILGSDDSLPPGAEVQPGTMIEIEAFLFLSPDDESVPARAGIPTVVFLPNVGQTILMASDRPAVGPQPLEVTGMETARSVPLPRREIITANMIDEAQGGLRVIIHHGDSQSFTESGALVIPVRLLAGDTDRSGTVDIDDVLDAATHQGDELQEG